MSKKVRRDLKKELALKEREQLLQEIANIDALLDGQLSVEEQRQLWEGLDNRLSFSTCVNWFQPLIEDSLSEIQSRLSRLIDLLDREFPLTEGAAQAGEQYQGELFQRVRAQIVIKMFIDDCLLLHALGRNGAAIIELHGVLERQAIQRLVSVLIPPARTEVGLKLVERSTLPDLTSILRDCDVVSKEDVKFAQSLTTIRNGLAHRNVRLLSNAILSGKQIRQVEIDTAVAEVDFPSVLIKAIRLLVKLLEWEEK